MSEKEQQFERIYKETEEFGRTQFVREIQMQINDNKKKDKEIELLNNKIKQLNENYKAVLHQRDDIAQNGTEMIENLLEKNKQLNNIIDELEEYLEHQYLEWKDCETDVKFMAYEDKAILDKLKELKKGKDLLNISNSTDKEN